MTPNELRAQADSVGNDPVKKEALRKHVVFLMNGAHSLLLAYEREGQPEDATYQAAEVDYGVCQTVLERIGG